MDESHRAIKQIRAMLPGQLFHAFEEVIPGESVPLAEGSRSRVYDTRTTFWAFLGQILRGGSQRDAVREVQATRQRLGLDPISDNTAAYSTARSRLPEEIIEEVIDSVRAKDIVLTDRGFCSFLNFGLITGRGADALARLHASRKLPFKGRKNDCLVTCERPCLSQMPPHILEEEWAQLPETIQVRYIRFKIKQPGFRTRENRPRNNASFCSPGRTHRAVSSPLGG